MSRARGRASLRLLLAAALILGGTLAIVRSCAEPATAPSPRAATAPPPAPLTTVPAAPPPSSATDPATAPGSPAPEASASTGPLDEYDGNTPDSIIQTILNAASPPDLPAATAATLTALGDAYLTADLTGVGRAQFGVWSGPASDPVAGLTIQATIARRDQGRADVADVTVIYSVDDPTGSVDQHRAVVTFALDGTAWVPVVNNAQTVTG